MKNINEFQEKRYLQNSTKYAKSHWERSQLVNASAFRKFFAQAQK